MVFAGRIIDKLGTKLGFHIAIALWSVGAIIHAYSVPMGEWAHNTLALVGITVFPISVLGFMIARAVLAIGEAGLDKVCETDMELQKKIFAAHIQWANEIRKPLIVHCVRAHAEVMQMLKQLDNKMPVIFHGFTKSKELALQLTAHGYYLSFGKAIEKSATAEILAALPIEQIFLETDKSEISIQQLYSLTASAFQIQEDSLSLQLYKNAATVFGAALTTV
mgnify:CR=1 FL=1